MPPNANADTYTYTYIHTYTYTYIHTYIHTYRHAYVYRDATTCLTFCARTTDPFYTLVAYAAALMRPKNAKTRGLGEADPQNAANALPNETRAGRGGGDKKRKEKGAAAAAPEKT